MSKRHAKVFGFENWKKCTGHGKRHQGVTTIHNTDGVGAGIKVRALRHKHLDTSVGYDLGTTHGKDNAIRAMLGPQHNALQLQPGTYYFRALIATFL